MSYPDLPDEIWLEIFSRIPAKTIGRCRTLSKYWKSHLSTNSFIKKHLITRKQTIQQENVSLTTKTGKLCIITSPTKTDEVYDDKSFPAKFFCVFGSCNGLVLAAGGGKMVLVNPITRKQVTIQPPVIPKTKDLGCLVSFACGFGYDSCAGDYKIVRICSYSSKNTLVDVYSVKNGVWKRVDCELVLKRYAFEGGSFVNGALHWLVCSKEDRCSCSCIAAFDLASEVLREIPLPKEFGRKLAPGQNFRIDWRTSNGVAVVGGCLLIVDNVGSGVADLWIMKEYGVAESWVKFRIAAQDDIYKWDAIVATLCFVEDGELLCLTSGKFLFAFDLKGGGSGRRVVLGGHDDRYYYGATFVDSLVSP